MLHPDLFKFITYDEFSTIWRTLNRCTFHHLKDVNIRDFGAWISFYAPLN